MANGQQYDNEKTGVLFKNDRKTTDSQPDYKGNAEVEGREYWLSAWIKEGKNGKYMRLAFTLKDQQGGGSQTAMVSQADPLAPQDDDIPF